MRALLLAAGKATRLGDLSRTKPKCLHEIGGEVLLDRLVRQLAQVGVEEFLINTHHLADQVFEHVCAAPWASRATVVFEPSLLGTLGTVRANSDFLEGGDAWLLHADNFIHGDLVNLRRVYELRPPGVVGALLAFPTLNPQGCGVVTVDDNGNMTGFFEKVDNPPSRIASAATVVLDSAGVAYARALPNELTDLSRDLLPRLSGRLAVVVHPEPIVDIGTPDGLERAQTGASGR